MKYHTTLIALAASLLIGFGPAVLAAASEKDAEQAAELAAEQAAEKALQAKLSREYEKTLAEAEAQQRQAEVAMEQAREQLEKAAEQRTKSEEERARARETQAAEMAEMHEQLNRARRELRETSREIARVNREVARARAEGQTSRFVYRTSERPIIGVVLGDATDEGYQVLGVSPDGPSERAGLQQGDIISSLGDNDLTAANEKGGNKLSKALKDIKAGEAVAVTVQRADKTIELTVVPEVRDPLALHSVTRFPSAPDAPGEVISIERIVVPEIDTAELAEQIKQIRIEAGERALMVAPHAENAPHGSYEFEFHELSELGDLALQDANLWFGLPMTRGLQLAEVDPDLGEYFKTDHGVLVLKVRNDNELQLKSGDVILKVGSTTVKSPAEFMRALREFDSGEELRIAIKRERKNKTLTATMPEKRTSFTFPDLDSLRITFESH